MASVSRANIVVHLTSICFPGRVTNNMVEDSDFLSTESIMLDHSQRIGILTALRSMLPSLGSAVL